MPFDTTAVVVEIKKTAEKARRKLEEQRQATLLAARLYLDASERLEDWIAAVTSAEEHSYSSYALPLPHIGSGGLVYPLALPFDSTGYRVIATDSSFIEADKHRGAFCHLINVGKAMIKYGEISEALAESIPHHYPDYLEPRNKQRADPDRVMQVQCAKREIEALYEMATGYAEQGGVQLAIFDGPLNQTLAKMSEADGPLDDLLQDFDDAVKAFNNLKVPIIGYNSRTKSDLVIRSVEEAALAGFFQLTDGELAAVKATFGYLDDGDLFSVLLAPGERSLTFAPWQPEKKQQRKDLRQNRLPIISFYLNVSAGGETAIERVDTLTDFAASLDTIQRLLLSQCTLGNGYPPVLNLADRYAFLTRGDDRETYFALLELEGLLMPMSRKSLDKQISGRNV